MKKVNGLGGWNEERRGEEEEHLNSLSMPIRFFEYNYNV